ncbi:Low-expression lectin 1 [Operophtera brumata]|uniref:Low-expression lectin 1 n=1 Tax=Operophtera brumata TaxID=104452 RepID=A0A0L7L3U6_OPEBR|nr:Low-expression lectin 1 [Operophtera brumata]
MHLEPQNWHQAYSTCLSAGGHLAIVNSQPEADYIKRLFREADSRRIPDNDFAYLGFSDLLQRHHFKTVHDRYRKYLKRSVK